MDIAIRKYNFIQELTQVDETMFEKLELFLKTNKKDWFLDLSNEEKQEIENGLNQADNNEFLNHDFVMNKFTKWHL
jgi:predicted transcriptional regulator